MAKQSKCPVCKSPLPAEREQRPHDPFCSKRCQQVDLGRWLDESYTVPVETGRVARQWEEQERVERQQRSYRTDEHIETESDD